MTGWRLTELRLGVGLGLLMLALQPWQQQLMVRLDRPDWRWLSGHLVHANLWHLAENLLGLGLLLLLFGRAYRPHVWVVSSLLAMLIIDVGLAWRGQLQSYYGFSGCLHAGFVLGVWSLPWPSRLGLMAVLLVKLLAEQYWGSPMTAWIGPVALDAHWLGAGAGMLAGLLFSLLQAPRNRA